MSTPKDKATGAEVEAQQAPGEAATAAAEPEVPAGKAQIVVAVDFSNPNRVGRTYTVDAEEARTLVDEGRARYAR